MEVTPYLRILQRTCDRLHLDRQNVFTAEQLALRTFHSDALEIGWRHWWWPQLMRCEQRWFRADWNSATTYNALDEVYLPLTGKYYAALQTHSNETPDDSDGTVNLSYWCVASETDSAADWDSTLAYAQGDRVLYEDTIYQAYTTVVAGTLPTNTGSWGPTRVFDRYVAKDQSWETNEIGTVRGCWDKNPRTTTRNSEVAFHESSSGIEILPVRTYVWIDFRLPSPELFGDVWSATETYAVGDQVFYTADFYNCLSATSAGESPDTAAAKWQKIEIPAFLATFLERFAASEFELSRRNLEASGQHRSRAVQELETQQAKYTRAQGEMERTVVG